MFNFKKVSKPNLNAVNSIIAGDMEIEGRITFHGTLKIAGKINGDIFEAEDRTGDTTVIIEGSVHGGTIEADHVVITGRVVVKKVIAHKSLIVISDGNVVSDEIRYGSITSDDTAVINGKLEKIVNESGLTVEA